MTLRDLHLGASLIHLGNTLDILDLKLWINALGEHIVSQGQDIHIACALAVAKKSSLHPLGSG